MIADYLASVLEVAIELWRTNAYSIFTVLTATLNGHINGARSRTRTWPSRWIYEVTVLLHYHKS